MKNHALVGLLVAWIGACAGRVETDTEQNLIADATPPGRPDTGAPETGRTSTDASSSGGASNPDGALMSDAAPVTDGALADANVSPCCNADSPCPLVCEDENIPGLSCAPRDLSEFVCRYVRNIPMGYSITLRCGLVGVSYYTAWTGWNRTTTHWYEPTSGGQLILVGWHERQYAVMGHYLENYTRCSGRQPETTCAVEAECYTCELRIPDAGIAYADTTPCTLSDLGIFVDAAGPGGMIVSSDAGDDRDR